MAIEHAIFKFDDLKVTSHYDRQTDRMTTKVLSSRPRINAARPITTFMTNVAISSYFKPLKSTKKYLQDFYSRL